MIQLQMTSLSLLGPDQLQQEISDVHRRPKDDKSPLPNALQRARSPVQRRPKDDKPPMPDALQQEISEVYRRPKDDKSSRPHHAAAVCNVNESYITNHHDDTNTSIDQLAQSLSKDTLSEQMTSESKEDDLTEVVSPNNQIKDILAVFRYIKQIGDGASCQVFKAQHKENGKFYALKKMSRADDVNLESLKKERTVLRKMVHPSIVSYFDSYVDNDSYYIATRYASGM